MAGSDLIKSINGSFLLGLSGFAGDLGVSGGGSSAGLGKAAQGDRIQMALRVGARTFAKAVEGVNSVISVVNISDAALEQLGGITDKLIALAEKSSKNNISNETRGRYDRDFQKLAKEFQRVVARNEQDGRDILSVEGLQEIFAIIGLNEEDSQSIAEVFSKFVTNKEDTGLASDETKGTRPIIVPIGAFPSSTTTPTREMTQVSNNTDGTAITNGLISQNIGVYADNVNYQGQNPNGNMTLTSVTTDGAQSALPTSINYDVQLLNVSETTGYSVIASEEDFLGWNPNNFNNLFVVDAGGQVLHQVTAAGTPGWDFDSADISADGMRVVFTVDDGFSTTGAGDYQILDLGADPGVGGTQLIYGDAYPWGAVDFGEVRVSESGSHMAYELSSGGTSYMVLRDTATHTFDATLLLTSNTYTHFGFVGSDRLALYNDPAQKIQSFTYGGGFSDLTNATTSIIGGSDFFSTSEGGDDGYVAYTGIVEGQSGAVGLVQADGDAIQSIIYSLSGGDTLSGLSLAENSSGGIDVGFLGVLDDKGDSDVELYRYTDNRFTTVNGVGAVKPAEVESIFSGSNANIRTRPNAYRTLEDLKALRKQIDENREALENARGALGKNLSLVREAGLAFLELSNQITSETDADQVASRLRNLIIRNATEALSQAENLRPLALAALNQITGVSDE